jgi:hypothetical protein
MVNPKCRKCGEKNESEFYYGKKNICKECLKKENKEKYEKKETLADKVAEIIKTLGIVKQENESFKKGFEDLSKEIDNLKKENLDLKNIILELRNSEINPVRGRSPVRPKSRSPSPVRPKSRSPSPVRPKSRSPSPVRVVSSLIELPQIKKFSCSDLNQFEKDCKISNLEGVKNVARKIGVSITEKGKAKNIDKLRAEVLGKIDKLRSMN